MLPQVMVDPHDVNLVERHLQGTVESGHMAKALLLGVPSMHHFFPGEWTAINRGLCNNVNVLRKEAQKRCAG